MLEPRKEDSQSTQLSEQTKSCQGQILLTVQEAADLLRSTTKTLYSYIFYDQFDCGYNLYCKFGRKVLFIKANLLKWIDEGMPMKKRPKPYKGR